MAISPDAEPALFAFIEAICTQVRAPLPRRVQVDCQVNASASFLPGRLATVRRDLVLTIGLPLAAGLSVRELGGVLAHEFGHFAQGAGMRLTMLVRGVNAWFARVVYERDRWDELLESWSKEADWRLMIVLWIARAGVFVSRMVLMALMTAGHAISCFMLRQMEYDADSYEVKFAGSEAFVRTASRLRHLNAAAQFGYNDLGRAWEKRALPSDFAAFLIQRGNRLPEDLLGELRRVPDARTGVFDTHPSDADRVRAAEAAAMPGVLVGGHAPATTLFSDFDSLSAAVTRHHYASDLRLDLRGVALVGASEVIRDGEQRDEDRESLRRVFLERVSECRPLRLPLDDVRPLDDAALRAALTSARVTMAASEDDLAERYRRFEQLAIRRDKAFCAEQLLLAGIAIPPGSFELAEATVSAAESAQTWAAGQQQQSAPALQRFEDAAARRLACAARLDAKWSQSSDARSLAEAFDAVAAVLTHVHETRRLMFAERLIFEAVSARQASGGEAPNAAAQIAALGERIVACLQRLRHGLETVNCPGPLTSVPTSLAARCGLDAATLDENAVSVVDRVMALYWDLLGRLASTCLRVEERA